MNTTSKIFQYDEMRKSRKTEQVPFQSKKITSNFTFNLIRPPSVFTKGSLNTSSICPPLALTYLSGVLKKAGYKVKSIDSISEGMEKTRDIPGRSDMEYTGLSPEEIIERIDPECDVIGISSMFSSEWPFTRTVIEKIKESYPDKPIVLGGEHATAFTEFILNQCKEIEIIAMGEGESIILDIADFYQGKIKDKRDVMGIAYLEDGKYLRNGLRPRIKNLDDIPWPDWDSINMNKFFDKKLSHGPYRGITMPIVASRGCPFACSFCSNDVMWTRKYLTRSVEDVVDEIEHYIKKYGIKSIEFYDLTTIIKRAWILEFCELIIKRNIKISWQITGGTRTEAIDEEVIKQMVKAGCVYLGFAPESGSEIVLKKIRKQVDLKRMINLFKIARKYNLPTRANLVIGFPDETRADIYKTLALQVKLAIIGVVDCPIFLFTPYPGSKYFEMLFDKKVIKEFDDNYFYSLGLDYKFDYNNRYSLLIHPKELMFYQMMGMLFFYGIYYMFRPKKLISFVMNFFGKEFTESVFEQRLIQNFKKMKT
jgi:anaerobic magnesium-protoporphyrin IX monomethyl ester cyclase